MSRRCPECGGLLGAGDAVCRGCGHPVPAVGGTERASSRAPRGLLEPRRDLRAASAIELGDAGPLPGREVSTVPVPGAGLGDIPAGNEGDAFDLSAILDVGAIPSAPPQAVTTAGRGGFVPAFTFRGSAPAHDLGDLGEASPSDLMPSASANEESNRRDSAGGGTWRVRNASGTTYDLASIEAVIQWLQSKDSFDGVRIARDGGAFRTLEEFPELLSRMGMRPGNSAPASDPSPRLELDVAGRKPQGSRAPAAQRTESRAPAARPPVGGPAPAAKRTAARVPVVGRTFGAGLSLVLAGGAVVVTLILARVATSMDLVVTEATVVEPALPAPEAPPGPALRAALQAFEAQRYTAAEQLLQQAVRTEKNDPRVFRYLALTLSRLGGRDHEARAALVEYRRARARAGRN